MLASKDVLQQFRAAPWKRPDEIDAFVRDAEALSAADLLKLLETLSGRTTDAQAHRARLTVFAQFVEKNPDKSLFVPFARALKGADAALRTTLAPLFVKVNSPTEHAELLGHLREKDPQLRQIAARALMQIGGGKTIFDVLSRVVGEREFAGRAEAIEVLVSFAKAQAIPALQSALAVGAVQEQVQALKHLGDARVVGKDPVAALRAVAIALQGQPEPVLVQAVASFSALSSEDDYWEYVGPFLDSAALNVAKVAVEGLRRFSSPRAIGALERKMRAGPRAVRLAVLNTLEVIGTDAVLPPLVDALGHRQIPVRNRAAEVLKNLSLAGKLDVARLVLWLLRSRDVNVRRMATEVIRSVPDPEGTLWPKLMTLLRDEDWWVRERVMDALVELGGLELTKHMIGYLNDPSDVVRRFAVTVLARLKDAKALRSLVQTATSDPDWWVRETSIEAIAAIGDARGVPYVVQLLSTEPELQAVCIQALSDMGVATAAPQVAALLGSESPDIRLAAVRFLDKFDAREQANLVAERADDAHPKVRAAVRDVMTRWSITATGRAVAVPLLDRLLIALSRNEGDDLIVAPNRPVYMKKVGRASPLVDRPLSADEVSSLLLPHLSTEQVMALQMLQDVDYSHEVKSEGLRFRANVFNQLGGVSAVFRRIKGELPEIERLGLPPIVKTFGDLKNGLVLVGGPTGSGKSTTLAALIDSINRNSSRHIISLEDPIEVIHRRKKSLVNQREIGTHTESFATALRSTLREDPNVILVGELRDLATIEFTVVAAETGHLVFGTVHTVSAATSVDRLISAFPPGQQEQVRATLADSLRAVVCQYLLKQKDGAGRVLAVEVMLNNEAVANLIRKGKAFQLPSVIATSREQGMQLMDMDLLRLLKEGKISAEDAYMKAASKKEFEAFVEEDTQKTGQRPVRAEAQPDGSAPRRPPTPATAPQRPAVKPPLPS